MEGIHRDMMVREAMRLLSPAHRINLEFLGRGVRDPDAGIPTGPYPHVSERTVAGGIAPRSTPKFRPCWTCSNRAGVGEEIRSTLFRVNSGRECVLGSGKVCRDPSLAGSEGMHLPSLSTWMTGSDFDCFMESDNSRVPRGRSIDSSFLAGRDSPAEFPQQ